MTMLQKALLSIGVLALLGVLLIHHLGLTTPSNIKSHQKYWILAVAVAAPLVGALLTFLVDGR